MRRETFSALSILITLGLLAGESAAQQSTTRGFTLGVHGSGASLTIEKGDRNDAGGGGLNIGYGLNRRFTLLAQLDGAEFDDLTARNVRGKWTLGHVDAAVRFHFANSLNRWIPYLQGGLGVRAVSLSNPVVDGTARNEVTFSGSGLSLGGGIDYYFTEALALDLQVLWTGGKFSTYRVDNVSVSGWDVDATSSRVNVGVSWWP